MRRSLFAVAPLAVALLATVACNPPKRSLLTEADPQAPADVAKPPRGAEPTDSGLVTRVIKPGAGKIKPAADGTVTVQYTGWTTDGRKFDSSRDRGKPATFNLQQVIAGWREGLQLMVKGEVRRMWIPQDLAYQGARGKPAGMLVFDVELISIEGVTEEADAESE